MVEAIVYLRWSIPAAPATSGHSVRTQGIQRATSTARKPWLCSISETRVRLRVLMYLPFLRATM